MKTIFITSVFILQSIFAAFCQNTEASYEIFDMKLFLSKGGRTEKTIAADAKNMGMDVYNTLFTKGKLNSNRWGLMLAPKDEYYESLKHVKRMIESKNYVEGLKKIKTAQEFFSLIESLPTIKENYIKFSGGLDEFLDYKQDVLSGISIVGYKNNTLFLVSKEDLKDPKKSEEYKNYIYSVEKK